MPSSPGIGMHVEVQDPDEKTILSRVYSSEGRISFTSQLHGEHVICLFSNSTAWFSGTQLVSIQIVSVSKLLSLRVYPRVILIQTNNFLAFNFCFCPTINLGP